MKREQCKLYGDSFVSEDLISSIYCPTCTYKKNGTCLGLKKTGDDCLGDNFPLLGKDSCHFDGSSKIEPSDYLELKEILSIKRERLTKNDTTDLKIDMGLIAPKDMWKELRRKNEVI